MDRIDSFTAVILAGGRSTRMGTNKAMLELQNRPIIAGIVAELKRKFKSILIVANEPSIYAGLGVTVVPDEYPGYGPLAGIHAGLKAAPGEGIFLVPCDMPFVNAELGLEMLANLQGADGLVLQKDGYLEPLYAIYTKRCLPIIESFLLEKRLKVIDFYQFVNIKILSTEKLCVTRPVEEILFNVNTPEDFDQAREIEGIRRILSKI
ncbi:MAG TPA: molybdenum cofactor guanylyltransferase [Verrucomicrobiae bacterium]|nr:molybdenum cofactor guanylyltransferase [Verrucomicrobiae bacterium]